VRERRDLSDKPPDYESAEGCTPEGGNVSDKKEEGEAKGRLDGTVQGFDHNVPVLRRRLAIINTVGADLANRTRLKNDGSWCLLEGQRLRMPTSTMRNEH
jgi:hypothetical protein